MEVEALHDRHWHTVLVGPSRAAPAGPAVVSITREAGEIRDTDVLFHAALPSGALVCTTGAVAVHVAPGSDDAAAEAVAPDAVPAGHGRGLLTRQEAWLHVRSGPVGVYVRALADECTVSLFGAAPLVQLVPPVPENETPPPSPPIGAQFAREQQAVAALAQLIRSPSASVESIVDRARFLLDGAYAERNVAAQTLRVLCRGVVFDHYVDGKRHTIVLGGVGFGVRPTRNPDDIILSLHPAALVLTHSPPMEAYDREERARDMHRLYGRPRPDGFELGAFMAQVQLLRFSMGQDASPLKDWTKRVPVVNVVVASPS